MKKFLSLLAIMAVIITTTSIATAATVGLYTYFSDVENSVWYGDAVNNLAAKGIINGYQDGTFKPNNSVSRAEVAVMLNNTLTYLGEESSIQEPKTYTNNTYNFSYQYPASVSVEKTPMYIEGTLTSYTISNYNAAVWEGPEGGPDTAYIRIYDNKDNLSIVDWAKANYNQTNFDDNTQYSTGTVDGKPSITYTVNGLGTFVYHYVKVDGYIYEIGRSYISEDPVIQNALNMIMSTLKFQ